MIALQKDCHQLLAARQRAPGHFGSWFVVVVDLKSFSVDTSNILGAILHKDGVAAMMGGRFGAMGACTVGAKCVHIALEWPGTMTMTYLRAALISMPGRLGNVK